MKQCIIADFEWCVTPHPTGDRFQYYNEILSAGAVRIDETGSVIDRFYSLIRPENAAYLHPVVLSSLRLSRDSLADAPEFGEVFALFLSFVGETRIFTWGCADRSALLQNLRMKAGCSAEKAGAITPQMRDLQPVLSRGAGIAPPYPSLAAVLTVLHLPGDNRHNAMADAEDTARIVSVLFSRDPALVSPLFTTAPSAQPVSGGEFPQPTEEQTSFRTPGEALNDARRKPRFCPVCHAPAGVGTWIRASRTEILTLCSCETDGRFLCTVSASETAGGTYIAHDTLTAFAGSEKARYEAARRAARVRRLQKAGTAPDQAAQTVQDPTPAEPSPPDHT